jgi:hypothetical protein
MQLRSLLRTRLGDAAGAASDAQAARALQPQVQARVAEIFGTGMVR